MVHHHHLMEILLGVAVVVLVTDKLELLVDRVVVAQVVVTLEELVTDKPEPQHQLVVHHHKVNKVE
jgi:hypothetical protein